MSRPRRPARLGRALAWLRARIDSAPAGPLIAGVAITALVVVLAVGALFLELVDEVTEAEGDHRNEVALVEEIHDRRTPPLTAFFQVATRLGDGWFCALLIGAAALALGARGRPALALTVIASSTGAALVTSALKVAVGRERPPLVGQLVEASGGALPSGHSSQAVACYGILAFALALTTTRTGVRIGGWVGAALLAAVIGLSRVYLGVHWPSDVLAGWLVGLAWLTVVVAAAWTLRRLDRPRRWWGRRPARSA